MITLQQFIDGFVSFLILATIILVLRFFPTMMHWSLLQIREMQYELYMKNNSHKNAEMTNKKRRENEKNGKHK